MFGCYQFRRRARRSVEKAKCRGVTEHDIEAEGWMAALSGSQRVYLQSAREMRKKRNQKLHTWQPFWIVDLDLSLIHF